MPRLLMLALDAAEPRLVEKWSEEGHLPNLRRLRERGRYGRLGSSARWFAGSQWATFASGVLPSEHGFYAYLGWRPERMTMARPSPEWLPYRAFWRDIGRRGRRVLAFDVPLAYPPAPLDGVEVVNWANHESHGRPLTHPPDVLGALRSRFGPPLRHAELAYPLPLERLRSVADQQSAATEHVSALIRHLLETKEWDLCVACIATAHRAGHKLWDGTGADASPPERRSAAPELRAALRRVYTAVDTAVGEIMEAAGEGTSVLVFSLHGMGVNTSRNELLPEMLRRILADDGPNPGGGAASSARFLAWARAAVPLRWRHAVKHRLPTAVQDRLTAF